MNWLYVGALAAMFGAGWVAQGWRMGEDVAELKAHYAAEAQEATQRELRKTSMYKEQSDAAVKKAESRLAVNMRDNDSLRTELAGLRGDIATNPERIRTATREAVNNYAVAATVVLDECTRSYSEMAGYAQGHASDVRTLIDAWPGYNKPGDD